MPVSESDFACEHIVKSYGTEVALEDLSLAVKAGEVCALLGPNGAGKTTLVSIIAGLRSADSGRLLFGGRELSVAARKAGGVVGLAGQSTGIYPTVSVRENLEFFAALAGLSKSGRAAAIDEVAALMELTELMDREGRALSGGEQRRLHTAMALLGNPAVLLLDEPTTGVDVVSRSRLLEAVRVLAAQRGCSVIYSTHYLPEVAELGASVAILDRGMIRARGSYDELLSQYGSGVGALRFVGEAPEPPPGVERDGTFWRLHGDGLAARTAALIAQLGDRSAELISVEVQPPSLDSVFLAVAGRRFEEGSES